MLDVGCGDGKILLALLRDNPQARGIGVEVSPHLAKLAARKAAAAGIDRLTILTADIRDASLDLAHVTTCVVFFVPYGLKEVFPSLLARLAPGTRIFTLLYRVPGVPPLRSDDEIHEYAVPPLPPHTQAGAAAL